MGWGHDRTWEVGEVDMVSSNDTCTWQGLGPKLEGTRMAVKGHIRTKLIWTRSFIHRPRRPVLMGASPPWDDSDKVRQDQAGTRGQVQDGRWAGIAVGPRSGAHVSQRAPEICFPTGVWP